MWNSSGRTSTFQTILTRKKLLWLKKNKCTIRRMYRCTPLNCTFDHASMILISLAMMTKFKFGIVGGLSNYGWTRKNQVICGNCRQFNMFGLGYVDGYSFFVFFCVFNCKETAICDHDWNKNDNTRYIHRTYRFDDPLKRIVR